MRPTINLATHGHINRRALYACYAFVGVLLLMAFALHLADWRASYLQSRILQQRLGELESQLGIEPDSGPVDPAEFASQLKEIRFSNQVISRDSYRWSLLLSQLEEVLPADVRITSIHPMFKEDVIQLRGEVREVGDLQEFLDSLQESDAFTDVLLLEQARQDPDPSAPGLTSVVSFGIQVRRGKS